MHFLKNQVGNIEVITHCVYLLLKEFFSNKGVCDIKKKTITKNQVLKEKKFQQNQQPQWKKRKDDWNEEDWLKKEIL